MSRSDASLARLSSRLTSAVTVAGADGAGVAGALDGTTGTAPADSGVAGDVAATGVGVSVAEGTALAGVGSEVCGVGPLCSGAEVVGRSGVASEAAGMSTCQPGRMRSGSVRRRPSGWVSLREASKIRGQASASSRCSWAISLSVSPLTTV